MRLYISRVQKEMKLLDTSLTSHKLSALSGRMQTGFYDLMRKLLSS